MAVRVHPRQTSDLHRLLRDLSGHEPLQVSETFMVSMHRYDRTHKPQAAFFLCPENGVEPWSLRNRRPLMQELKLTRVRLGMGASSAVELGLFRERPHISTKQ